MQSSEGNTKTLDYKDRNKTIKEQVKQIEENHRLIVKALKYIEEDLDKIKYKNNIDRLLKRIAEIEHLRAIIELYKRDSTLNLFGL